jgi:uncharacterized protein (DUF885 family)
MLTRSLLLVAALASAARAGSEPLAAALRDIEERGWLRAECLTEYELADATAMRELLDAMPAADLDPEERIDRQLARHRLGFLLEYSGRLRLRESSLAAWLPRDAEVMRAAEAGSASLDRLVSRACRDAKKAFQEMSSGDAKRSQGRLKEWRARAEKLVRVAGAEDGPTLPIRTLDSLAAFLDRRAAEGPAVTEAERRRRTWDDYVLRFRWVAGIDDGPEEILALGEKERRATLASLERQARRVDPNRSWREIAEELRGDHPKAEELLEACRAEMREALAFAKERKFVSIPDWADNVDTRWGDPKTPTPYGHYWPLDPADPELRGWYVVVPVTGLKDAERESVLRGNNRAWIRVVSLHEAVPGHHLQFAIAARRPAYRREFYNPAFVEGWGLYCEELMHRHGYYDAKTRLSQLKMRLWRCARALIDVGAQFGGMTKEEAVRILVEDVGMETPSARMEVARYLASPGYYSGYLVGMTRMAALRKAVEAKQGREFDERAFHDRLLQLGPLPFRVIEEAFLGE